MPQSKIKRLSQNVVKAILLTKPDVIGLINVIKKIPMITDTKLGIIITEKFDIPETFKAIISSVFLIFRKNQIPENKITKGNIL